MKKFLEVIAENKKKIAIGIAAVGGILLASKFAPKIEVFDEDYDENEETEDDEDSEEE